jgi:hypothetical protein
LDFGDILQKLNVLFQTPTMNELMDGPTSTTNASFHKINRSFYAILAKEKHIHNGKSRLGSKL